MFIRLHEKPIIDKQSCVYLHDIAVVSATVPNLPKVSQYFIYRFLVVDSSRLKYQREERDGNYCLAGYGQHKVSKI